MNEKLNLEQIVEDKVPIEKECIVSLDIRAQWRDVFPLHIH